MHGQGVAGTSRSGASGAGRPPEVADEGEGEGEKGTAVLQISVPAPDLVLVLVPGGGATAPLLLLLLPLLRRDTAAAPCPGRWIPWTPWIPGQSQGRAGLTLSYAWPRRNAEGAGPHRGASPPATRSKSKYCGIQ